MAITQEKGLVVRRVRIRGLDALHRDGKRTFIYLPCGPNYHVEVAQAVHEAKLSFPLMDENVSLIYSAWQNPDKEYSARVIETLRNYFVLATNGLLYLPKKEGEDVHNGVLIDDNFDVRKLKDLNKNREKLLEYKSSLITKLNENDPEVRFVPFGYPTGEVDNLSNHSLVRGLAGEYGSVKLDEVASKYKEKYRLNTYIASFDGVVTEYLSCSALNSKWFGIGLFFRGKFLDDVRVCCAFGVQR